MIEVLILKNDEPLARIEIKNESEFGVHEYHTDYSVKFAVERGTAVGLHTRWIHAFPRNKYNALALLLQALNTLDPKELELESGFDPDEAPVSTDMARRLGGAMREIQAGFSRLHRDGPSFWS